LTAAFSSWTFAPCPLLSGQTLKAFKEVRHDCLRFESLSGLLVCFLKKAPLKEALLGPFQSLSGVWWGSVAMLANGYSRAQMRCGEVSIPFRVWVEFLR